MVVVAVVVGQYADIEREHHWCNFVYFSGAPSNPPTHNGSGRWWVVDGGLCVLSHTRAKHNWVKSVISIHMLKRHQRERERERETDSNR